MQLPKPSGLVLIGVGFFIFGAISLAPNATRRTVIGENGKPHTEIDTQAYILGNWFSFSAFAVGVLAFSLAGAGWINNRRTS